jgi:hypothetical protein
MRNPSNAADGFRKSILQATPCLKQPTQPQGWEQYPQYGQDEDQHYQDLEQVRQPPVANELVDEIETKRADDDVDQDVDQEQQHRLSPPHGEHRGDDYGSKIQDRRGLDDDFRI